MAAKYSKDFDPILLEKQTANLFGSGLPRDGLAVRCLSVGALPQYEKDFGALVADKWKEDQTDDNLIMPVMTLGVFRMKIITDMRLRLKSPSSVGQWRTRDAKFYLPQFPVNGSDQLRDHLWRQSEFMVWQDDTKPAFDLYSAAAKAMSIVQFSGWRYAFTKLEQGKGTIDIWVHDWPSTSQK